MPRGLTARLMVAVSVSSQPKRGDMPASRMMFTVPIKDSARFVPYAMIDEVLLPGRRLADGAVVVDATPSGDNRMHVTLDVYT